MKRNKYCIIQLLTVGFVVLFCSCSSKSNESLPKPEIKAGIANVSGIIKGILWSELEEKQPLELLYPKPVTNEIGHYRTTINEDGSFLFDEVPVQYNTIGYMRTYIYEGFVELIPGEDTKLEIVWRDDETGNLKINFDSRLGLTSNDLLCWASVVGEMAGQFSPKTLAHTGKPGQFAKSAINAMEKKLKIAKNDTVISEKAKNLASNEFKLTALKELLLDYETSDKSYYSFLSYFNLNNPQYLYNGTYPRVLQSILSNETLNIPPINDTPIDIWMQEVKNTMAGFIGSDEGLFYDMLAANAYARQFNNELKPLSDKQKENIEAYFENGEIAKILLQRNEELYSDIKCHND